MSVSVLGAACSNNGSGAGGAGGAGGGGAGGANAKYDAAWAATLTEVSERITALGIPGAGVAIVLGGKLAYSGGVGVRARSTGEPVTKDTLFRSSSAASKTAIAVALLDLAEEGKVDLHAPVSALVPAIKLDPTYATKIDLDTLLLQRAGIDCCPYRTACAAGSEGVLDYFQAAGAIASPVRPGVTWEYTASGSVVGAAVLETVESRPFTEVVRDRVLVPAGMTTATYDPAQAVTREHAVGHLGNAELDLDASPFARCGEYVASTGLLASAADHGRFLELLLAPGRVLEQPSLDLFEGVAHNPGFGPDWSYGYQVFGLAYKGVRVFHHYGSSDGYTSGVSWVPERGFGVVLLTNGDAGTSFDRVYAVEELRWRIADRFLELTGDPPDNSTPPSTWGKYVGTYVDPVAPSIRYVFAQDASDRLTFAIDPLQPTPRVLVQGAPDAPYEGGDIFTFLDGPAYFLAGFFPDESGTIHFAGIYTSYVSPDAGARSASAHPIGERVP